MINPPARDFTLVLGLRHIAVVLFAAVILLGSFSAMAYIAGRAGMPSVELAGMEAEADGPERVLIIDSAGGEEPVYEAKPEPVVEPVTTVTISPTPKTVMAGFEADTYFQEPTAGQLFLQVAAADRGVAEVFAEYLTRKSFPCQIASGPDERNYRVLVGPIQDQNQLARLRTGLETAGFNPFPRRYRSSP